MFLSYRVDRQTKQTDRQRVLAPLIHWFRYRSANYEFIIFMETIMLSHINFPDQCSCATDGSGTPVCSESQFEGEPLAAHFSEDLYGTARDWVLYVNWARPTAASYPYPSCVLDRLTYEEDERGREGGWEERERGR